MWGEAPANDNATKFGTGVDVHDVITHAKFQGEILRGSDFTGVEFWLSPMTLHMGLNTVLRYSLHVITSNSRNPRDAFSHLATIHQCDQQQLINHL